MFESLLVLALIGLFIGVLFIVSLGYRELRQQMERRLADDEIMAQLLRGTLDTKAKEPYWSCQSTTRARAIAADLIKNAQEAIGTARESRQEGLGGSIKLERRARSKLSAAMHILWLTEGELVPLIDRMRQAVEDTHVRALETHELAADLLSGLEARGIALPAASSRLTALKASIEAMREEIPRAPVTTLKALNAESGAINAVLKEIAGLLGQQGGVKH